METAFRSARPGERSTGEIAAVHESANGNFVAKGVDASAKSDSVAPMRLAVEAG
jgi:hypothetical protein